MQAMLNNLSKFGRAVRDRGLSRAIDVSCAHLLANERRSFERKYRLDTEREAYLDHLTITSQRRHNGYYYGASHPRVVTAMIDNVVGELNDRVFIDYGSGKGLVILLAATYPFKEAIGVEFAQELHEIAEDNIAKFDKSVRQCDRVRSLHQDAAEFELPAEACVLYFCNPFGDAVMEEVIGNIESAWRRHGKEIYVLYQQLAEEEEHCLCDPFLLFESADFLVEQPMRFRSLWERLLLKHLHMKVYKTLS